jgi:uncharacterized protein
LIITLITIFFTIGIARLEIDMGYEMMVSPKSDVFKDTEVYEDNFGGDGVYLLLSGEPEEVITQEMLQKVTAFTTEAKKIPEITGSIDFITLMNEMLDSDLPMSMPEPELSNSDLTKVIQNEFSEDDLIAIQQEMQESLTKDQANKIGAYTQSLLTNEQQLEISNSLAASNEVPSEEMQGKLMQSVFTKEQQDKIQEYTQSILTDDQMKDLQSSFMKKLPNLEELSTETIRELVFSDNGNVPEMLEQLIPENGNHLLINLTTSGKVTPAGSKEIIDKLNELIDEAKFSDSISIKIAGNHAINGQIDNVVMNTMGKMLILSIILMVIVLFLIFPVRRRLISLAYVLVGMFWTFGIMGWVGIPVTIATMATLPILIGLGTDFGVQFHNRYEEEYAKSNFNVTKAVVNSLKHIGPAVGIAVVLMALVFLTMFLSKAAMMQQFGLALAIGAISCYVVEMALLFATFGLADKKKKEVAIKQVNTSRVSRVLSGYLNFVKKFPVLILLVVVALSGYGFLSESKIGTETNIQRMLPKDMQGVKDSNYLQEVIGSTTHITFLMESEDVSKKETLSWLSTVKTDLENNFEKIEGITTLATTLQDMGQIEAFTDQQEIDQLIDSVPDSLMKNLMSENRQYTTIQVQVDPDLSSSDQVVLLNDMMDELDIPSEVKVSPAGVSVLSLYAVTNIGANSTLMKVLGIGILLVGLFLVYRRIKFAVFSVVPIVLVLGFTPLSLLVIHTDYNPLTIALSSLVLGIGAEFTILIIERYKEELVKGHDAVEAIKIAVANVGQAITASGLTVIVGFSTLMFIDFPAIREFGVTTVIDVTLCLIFALTIVPALIFIFNKKDVKVKR